MKKILLALSFLASTSSFADTYWVSALRSPCVDVCQTEDLDPVKGGQIGDRNFYVCKGNSNTGDVRPGFQLPGFNPNSCELSIGGTMQSLNYSCLCTDGVQKEIFR